MIIMGLVFCLAWSARQKANQFKLCIIISRSWTTDSYAVCYGYSIGSARPIDYPSYNICVDINY